MGQPDRGNTRLLVAKKSPQSKTPLPVAEEGQGVRSSQRSIGQFYLRTSLTAEGSLRFRRRKGSGGAGGRGASCGLLGAAGAAAGDSPPAHAGQRYTTTHLYAGTLDLIFLLDQLLHALRMAAAGLGLAALAAIAMPGQERAELVHSTHQVVFVSFFTPHTNWQVFCTQAA